MNINDEQLENINNLLSRVRNDIDNAQLIITLNASFTTDVKRNQLQYFLETAVSNCKSVEKMLSLINSKRLA
tara:strand:- start:6051 stop:6266 length:216 start_codon:yes stop_codon:yes gene_type:complete